MEICLLTSRASRARDREMSHFIAAAEKGGHHAEVIAWEDDAAWERFDAILVRSVWDYWSRLGEFLTWIQRVRNEHEGPMLVNDARLIRWNCHKRYLEEFEQHGVPVIPTRIAGSLAECLDVVGALEVVVVKPAVACGAVGCARVPTGDLGAMADAFEAARAVWPDVVVQPYHASIIDRGETSAVVIDGTVLRSLRKLPRTGDWRVQREYGGTVRDVALAPEEERIVDVCLRRVTARCGVHPLYMRVDMIAAADGAPLLSELELIEPVLYADVYPEIAEALIAAVAARVEAVRGDAR